MRDQGRGSIRRLLPYLALAVLVHLAALPWLPRLLEMDESPVEITEIETLPVSPRDWEKNKKVKSRPAYHEALVRKTVEEREKAKEKERLRGQVVDIPRPVREEEPDRTNLVSEYASRVEKESKSKYQKKDYEHAAAKPTRTDEEVKAAERAATGESKDQISLGAREEQKKKGTPEQERRLLVPFQRESTALQLPRDSQGDMRNRPHREAVHGNNPDKLQVAPDLLSEPNPDGRGGVSQDNLPSLAQLMPDLAVLDHIRGDPANDYLPDLDEADETRLNTRKSYLAAYINRIKRTVSQFWRPREALIRARRSGEILSPRDYVTELKVVLNSDGSLHKLAVVTPSGIEEFDKAGMTAFEEAGSFPNPPPGIKDPDGSIRFRFSFALVLVGASRPMFQLTLSPAVEGWMNPYRRGLLPTH